MRLRNDTDATRAPVLRSNPHPPFSVVKRIHHSIGRYV